MDFSFFHLLSIAILAPSREAYGIPHNHHSQIPWQGIIRYPVAEKVILRIPKW